MNRQKNSLALENGKILLVIGGSTIKHERNLLGPGLHHAIFVLKFQYSGTLHGGSQLYTCKELSLFISTLTISSIPLDSPIFAERVRQ